MTDFRQAATQLADADPAVRAAAAEQLATAGSEAGVAAVQLVKACGDEQSVQTWAVAALEDSGPPPAAAMAELMELAESTQPLVAYWAVTLLGRLGATASCAEAVLVKRLQAGGDLATRERAAWALGQIAAKSPASIAALEQVSQARESRLARLARDSLQQVSN